MNITKQVRKVCEKHAYNGVVYIVDEDKQLFYEGFGYKNIESQSRMPKSAIFRIGSITKQFTAVAILQLIEKGLIHLTDTIDQFIDHVPYQHFITIHQLLSNCSGIGNFDPMDCFDDILSSKRVNERLVKEVVFKQPLHFIPGEKFEYSSSGYIILTYLIELITKKPYHEYLNEHIFKPLRMDHSGFDFLDTDRKDFVTFYGVIDGKIEKAKEIDMRIASGGGGLYSTPLDLEKWYHALLSYQLISKASLDKMFSIQTPMTKTGGYGYGVIVDPYLEHEVIFHPGNGPGVFAQNTIYDRKIICIMLSNINDAKTFRATLHEMDTYIKENLL